VAYADGSYERGIAADENVIAYLGLMLRYAVVIAGDGPGADVRFAADGGIAEVSQVQSFGAFMQHRILYFDKISNAGPGTNICAGTQTREWPDFGFKAHATGIDNGVRADDGIVIHPGIAENAAGLNLAARADACFAEKLDARLD
jgi:hypothetical protein